MRDEGDRLVRTSSALGRVWSGLLMSVHPQSLRAVWKLGTGEKCGGNPVRGHVPYMPFSSFTLCDNLQDKLHPHPHPHPHNHTYICSLHWTLASQLAVRSLVYIGH
ncbi:hypothetical protein LY76DRAFT_49641 [Colletotrichum caudatum]|nr:hypothetical protein LY76DRAFT_49641 [Colletotrichum caudatum]